MIQTMMLLLTRLCFAYDPAPAEDTGAPASDDTGSTPAEGDTAGNAPPPLDVPAIYMWQTTFDGLFYGRGAAIGIILLVSVAVLIIPYIRYTLKTEAQS